MVIYDDSHSHFPLCEAKGKGFVPDKELFFIDPPPVCSELDNTVQLCMRERKREKKDKKIS